MLNLIDGNPNTEETGLDGEPVTIEERGKWQREPGKRGRLSAAEKAAKEAWENGTVIETDVQPSEIRKTGKVKREKSLDQFARLLLLMHSSFAMIVPELAIDQEEANMLTASIAEVGKYYSIPLDGKTGAIFGLVSTCGVIYGPRAIVLIKKYRDGKNSQAS